MGDREELVAIVERLRTADFETEEAADQAVAQFRAAVPHPRPLDLIFHSHLEFDSEPTADEIVQRALDYQPFEL